MRVLAALLLGAGLLPAQVEVKGILGDTVFLDDSAEHHLHVGGAVRFYVWKRLSIEPEFQYLRGSRDHYDIVFLPNVAYDFASRTSQIVPYVIGGLGVLRSTTKFEPRSFSGKDYHVSGGGGVKLFLSGNWFLAPEVRIGASPHIRYTFAVGYAWKR